MSTTARTCWLAAAIAALAVAPAAARAETYVNPNLIHIPGTGPSPGTPYPSNISVSGISGTVTKTSVQLINVNSGGLTDELDLVLQGPGGQKVLLWSDACGSGSPPANSEIAFDEAASGPLADSGPCSAGTYLPSDYTDAPADDLSPGGGPAPPYAGLLSAFNGASPNGTWSLYAFSDTNGDFFDIGAWALTLTIRPPPAAGPPVTETGLRAAALRKCKRKHGKARKKCKRKAGALPV